MRRRLSGVWEEVAYLFIGLPVPSLLHTCPQTHTASTTPNIHLAPTLTILLGRAPGHVWTESPRAPTPGPGLHVPGHRHAGLTREPGPDTPRAPLQLRPLWGSIWPPLDLNRDSQAQSHTSAPTPSHRPRGDAREGSPRQRPSSSGAVLTGAPFSPAGPGGPWGPGLPGIPMGPAAPAGPLSPGDPWVRQESGLFQRLSNCVGTTSEAPHHHTTHPLTLEPAIAPQGPV